MSIPTHCIEDTAQVLYEAYYHEMFSTKPDKKDKRFGTATWLSLALHQPRKADAWRKVAEAGIRELVPKPLPLPVMRGCAVDPFPAVG